MNFERNQNPKLEANGAQRKNSLTENKGKRPYKIAAAILAVLVLHFAWQFSFVQKENTQVAEDSLNFVRLDVLPVESLLKEKTVESGTDSTAKKTEAENVSKSGVPIKYSPPAYKSTRSAVKTVKKKTAREPRSERLRRAEKLLTGF
jgi:hypothetical protein